MLQKLKGNLRAARVFYPTWGLLLVLVAAMFGLIQGQDILQYVSERPGMLITSHFAILFMAFTMWYSARLFGFTQLKVLENGRWVSYNLLRFCAFSVYTIFIAANLKLLDRIHSLLYAIVGAEVIPEGLRDWAALIVLFIFSLAWYRVITKICQRCCQKIEAGQYKLQRNLVISLVTILILSPLLPCLSKESAILLWMVSLFLSQSAFTLLVHMRYTLTKKLDNKNGIQRGLMDPPVMGSPLWVPINWIETKLRAIQKDIDPKELDGAMEGFRDNWLYGIVFNVLGIIAALLMAIANWSTSFAQLGGPLLWVLIGLTGILGTIYLFRTVSRMFDLKLGGIVIVWMLLVGWIADPHEVRIIEDQSDSLKRESFETKLRDFASTHADQDTIPLVFIMSDGGAHRSGYWVTSMLSKLDHIESEFFQQVFCFAGASGGSVGNLSYYQSHLSGVENTGKAASQICSKDYFSHTVARMLGHDVLNLFIPVFPDRGAGLEDAFIAGALEESTELDFEKGFHRGSIKKWTPILTMNTTRMEDASSAVISTVAINSDPDFDHRPDVLGNMAEGEFIRIGSAGILRLRFPFFSPAGAISTSNESDDMDYYVDGGYLDNSGAGIVLEMLLKLKEFQDSDSLNPMNKLVPVIIHFRNQSDTLKTEDDVHPLTNNLAAPIKAIVGSYGQQTDILTTRLQKYLSTEYQDQSCYHEFNLLSRPTEKEQKSSSEGLTDLSFNWLISDKTKSEMDGVVNTQGPRLVKLAEEIALQ
ncbi:MAG: hypothetical protein HRT74_07140 [Flavobacteriales bacterium]|nr:hypothetical protein [Flavobacteriales bacterium]